MRRSIAKSFCVQDCRVGTGSARSSYTEQNTDMDRKAKDSSHKKTKRNEGIGRLDLRAPWRNAWSETSGGVGGRHRYEWWAMSLEEKMEAWGGKNHSCARVGIDEDVSIKIYRYRRSLIDIRTHYLEKTSSYGCVFIPIKINRIRTHLFKNMNRCMRSNYSTGVLILQGGYEYFKVSHLMPIDNFHKGEKDVLVQINSCPR